ETAKTSDDHSSKPFRIRGPPEIGSAGRRAAHTSAPPAMVTIKAVAVQWNGWVRAPNVATTSAAPTHVTGRREPPSAGGLDSAAMVGSVPPPPRPSPGLRGEESRVGFRCAGALVQDSVAVGCQAGSRPMKAISL